MADKGSIVTLKAAIQAVLNNSVPDQSIEPDDHNALLEDLLDTITGLDKVLRHNNETGGYNLQITEGDLLKLQDSGFTGDIDTDTLTAFRTYTFQDASGTVAFLSDIVGGASNFKIDRGLSAVTSGNESATGVTISNTPANNGDVMVFVGTNPIEISGDNTKNGYFSPDGGTTKRAIADITAGDEFIWNGVISGVELDTADEIIINYVV